jgi:hypothetical protein
MLSLNDFSHFFLQALLIKNSRAAHWTLTRRSLGTRATLDIFIRKTTGEHPGLKPPDGFYMSSLYHNFGMVFKWFFYIK